MGKDGRARGMQPLITIRVIEVPVGIDKVLNWIRADTSQGVSDFGTCTGKTRVDEKLTVWTCQHRDVPAGAHKSTYIAAEWLDCDGRVCRFLPRFLYEARNANSFCSGEERAWSEQPCRDEEE